MSNDETRNLWKLLWEYDPNGLVVADIDLNIKLVNASFCQMFNVVREDIIGKPISDILGDAQAFKKVWDTNKIIRGSEKEYPERNLWVRQVMFPIKDENIIACIMVDITQEIERKREMLKLKSETVKKVNEVVDNQMKVVQEIAGLLGETTAETKISLLKIIQMVEQEIV